MKKVFYYILFSFLALILQIKFKLIFTGIDIVPDFLLLVVVFSALFSGTKTGILMGLILGFIQDIYLGGFFGLYTIIKAIAGGLTGIMEGKIYKKNILIPPMIVFILSLLQEHFIIPLSQKLLFKINYLEVLKGNIFPFSLYNLIAAFLIYLIIYFSHLSRSKYYE